MKASYPRLGVNIDHVATLRQARGTSYPDPVEAALIAEEAGADQIVCHLREDRRHIQDHDLIRLRKSLKTRLNLEMAPTEEMVQIASDLKPDLVTLVPERRQELTTEGGLDLITHASHLQKIISLLSLARIPVSLFIHPSLEDMQRAKDFGVMGVEIHTGHYADAKEPKTQKRIYEQIVQATHLGKELSLKVFAGHGLHTGNVFDLTKIKEIEEYNIGHSIIARSVFIGIGSAVREMKNALLLTSTSL